ncbi:hypothetical protein QIT30_gp17 [Saccharolobus solfataricus rod-shaped virus 1]|uniref:Uncharacterized protein n=1 Tax=Saccharolobus solfataricus rod-shaped virus 1 TaxID=2730619 RepID=A0A6M3VZG1_SSRV1|nr:hypothetical protein QIT30_gp17 [Saccharolobus solfataricus rod-shaped virus 1]QJF12293.1 hypothetical protein SSRV1_gp17 [Saccharolobus solfataricus rod-shaped virus 1]
MSEKETIEEIKPKIKQDKEFSAKLFVALDNLALELATVEDENIRKSELYKKAQEVIKILKEVREKTVK